MGIKQIPRIRIVKVGTLGHEVSEIPSTISVKIKTDLGIGGGSTVTLVEAGQRILVDTGFDYEWLDTASNNRRNVRSITIALRDWGLAPDEIDIVFITHWHKDHFGNLGTFKKARRMASKSLVCRFELENFIGVDDREEIAEGVRVLPTPGHTIDHVSLIVDSVFGDVKARVGIAGDAIISNSYFQSGQTWRYNVDFYDGQAANESVLRLADQSDIIIPGHGVPFMTYRPEWLD